MCATAPSLSRNKHQPERQDRTALLTEEGSRRQSPNTRGEASACPVRSRPPHRLARRRNTIHGGTATRSEVRDEADGRNAHRTAPDRATTASPELAAPSLALPKGGGAIRGIGEKFAANPVTGTGSITVPIATSPGRSGFGPQLALSYDSGAGNGPFGFGWSLSLPAITRKTDKGLPQYRRRRRIRRLPPLRRRGPGPGPSRLKDGSSTDDTVDGVTATASAATGRGSRACSRGSSAGPASPTRRRALALRSRGQRPDPLRHGRATPGSPTRPDPGRIFTWLICETRDDKGNAVVYDYKPRGRRTASTSAEPASATAAGRDDPRRAANRYLKRIRYGNRTPLLDAAGQRPRFLAATAASTDADWMFEVVFDYGEHDAETTRRPDDATRRRAWAWPCRRTRSPPTAPASRCAPTGSASAC